MATTDVFMVSVICFDMMRPKPFIFTPGSHFVMEPQHQVQHKDQLDSATLGIQGSPAGFKSPK